MTNPVFLGLSGGGVNGVAHLGVLIELNKAGYFDNRDSYLVGTSSGAFNLLAVALNFTTEDYLSFLKRIDFPSFLYSGGFFGYLNRFIGRFGAHSGRYIRQLANEEIKRKTGIDEATFADLHRYDPSKNFFVIAVNISKKGIISVFSHKHTPKVKVADAIQASAAVPFLYSSVRFKENEEGDLVKNIKGDHYIDGGVIDNFILHFFDSNKYVQLPKEISELVAKQGYNPYMLGVYLLDNEHQIDWIKEGKKPPSIRFTSVAHYGKVVTEAVCYGHKNEILRNPVDAKRILFVNTFGNPPFNFKLDQKMKDMLLAAGQEPAIEHLENKEESSEGKSKHRLLRSKL